MIASKSEEIGNVISNVFNEIGFDNYIIVEDKVIDKCTYETINGMKLDFGYHIEGSIGENITKLNVYNAYVYTLEYISNINDLEMFMNNNKDIVIFCDDYENEILNDLNDYNKLSKYKIYIIKTLLKSDRSKEVLTDIKYYANSFNKNNIVNEIIIEKDKTIIINNSVNKDKLNERINYLKVRLSEEEFEFEKEFIEKRISALNGKMGIIYSYGLTELERIDKKLRIEDALNTAINSYKYGVVKGCGVTLLNIANDMKSIDNISTLIKEVLKSPYNKILENTGKSEIDTTNIIDSYKVVTEEINNSFSIAMMLLTTNALVINNVNNYSKIDIDKIM